MNYSNEKSSPHVRTDGQGNPRRRNIINELVRNVKSEEADTGGNEVFDNGSAEPT